jgi:type VI secretion system protein ImpL
MKAKLAVPAVLLAYLSLAWWIPRLMKLNSPDMWILRGGLALLGLAGAGAWLWFRPRAAGQTAAPAAALPLEREIDLLLKEAAEKLGKARLPGGSSIGALPVFFLVGDSGTAKTSALTNSGLEPELLAGHVFQDGQIAPTRLANLWFARGAVWAEAGGGLSEDAAAWQHLVRRLEAGKLATVLRGKSQAPRAALVFFDCEVFTTAGATDAVAARAQSLNTRLQEVSRLLGISFPIYVLFSRMDRIPYFTDFASLLTNEEAGAVFGVTLPLTSSRGQGVYSEEQTKLLTEAFENVFHWAANARPEFLSRENQPENLPNIYEFAREFRKIRPLAVRFLVDLCRPRQLAAGPFLRGFYFCGVRPVVQEDYRPSASAETAEAREQVESAAAATRFFDLAKMRMAPVPRERTPLAPVSRRVPQWVFLKQLFHQVLLRDQAATGASGASTKAGALQRALLGTAVLLGLVSAVGFTVSYRGNTRLQERAITVARAFPAGEPSRADISRASLARLEDARQLLVELRQHRQSGPPLSLRWGLYSGDALYPRFRRAYFQWFGRLLFAGTQNALLADLRALPPAPGPADAYDPPYRKLKAYLITTSHPQYSTRAFLSPVLLDRFVQDHPLDSERRQMAARQFDFYSEELLAGNPYAVEADAGAVQKARAYLDRFGDAERIYRGLIADASGRHAPVHFNRLFPGSAAVVVNQREVPGAFTADGFNWLQRAFENPNRSGEVWVLGSAGGPAGAQPGQMREALRARYRQDYIAEWRHYLRAGSVNRYANLKDAAGKLALLSGPQSPLLIMLALASRNTGVSDPEVAGGFKAAQSVVPPAGKEYIDAANMAYMKALLDLQAAIEQAAGQPGAPPEAAVTQIRTAANAANAAVGQLRLNFGSDPEAAAVHKLLRDPILHAENVLRQLGPAGLNAKGAALCQELNALLWNKYPFNPRAAGEATPEDLNAALQKPQGAFWKFYEAHLKDTLVRQGNNYVPGPAAPFSFTTGFLRFFNTAAQLSDLLYAANPQQPEFSYSLRILGTEQIQSATVTVDGRTVSYPGTAVQMTWPGKAAPGVKVTIGGITWKSYEGRWSLFRFLNEAKRSPPPHSGSDVFEWEMSFSGSVLPFRMEVAGPRALVQRGSLADLRCVGEIAR